ncbi:hypothetical protein D3C78_1842770 [compost metagenome]
MGSTDPTRTFTVTGKAGSSKRTMVGPLLPMTAIKHVTARLSRKRINTGSLMRKGSAWRMAATPTISASRPRWYCWVATSWSTSPSAIRLIR